MHQYVTFIGGFPIRFYGIFFSLGSLRMHHGLLPFEEGRPRLA